jgi:hypothetical protein
MDPCVGVLQSFARSRLRADLDNLPVLAGGGHHLAAFPHVVRRWLLAVHVFAGLDRGNSDDGVDVIRRRNRHGVDVGLVQQLAVVGVKRNDPAGPLFQLAGPLVEDVFVHVAKGVHLLGELPKVPIALAVDANHGTADVLGFGGRCAAGEAHGRGGAEGGLHELAAMECHRFSLGNESWVWMRVVQCFDGSGSVGGEKLTVRRPSVCRRRTPLF